MTRQLFKDAVAFGLYLDPQTKHELDTYVRMNAASKSSVVRRIVEGTVTGIYETPEEVSHVGAMADKKGRWVPYIINFERDRLETIKRFAEDNGFYNMQSFMRNTIRTNLSSLK